MSLRVGHQSNSKIITINTKNQQPPESRQAGAPSVLADVRHDRGCPRSRVLDLIAIHSRQLSAFHEERQSDKQGGGSMHARLHAAILLRLHARRLTSATCNVSRGACCSRVCTPCSVHSFAYLLSDDALRVAFY